jgi:hypothetical protein
MGRAREFVRRYRIVGTALAVSALVHAAILRGIPERVEPEEPQDGIAYTATLDPAAAAVDTAPVPAPAARAKPAPHHAKPAPHRAKLQPTPAPLIVPHPLGGVAPEEAASMSQLASLDALDKLLGTPPLPPTQKVAMAAPTTLRDEPPAKPFPTDALPENLSISYVLNSAFADGHAEYEWTREGDTYRIHGEAQAEGFFTLFLEGRIVQETNGTVTPQGLRPERFVERRPGAGEEGLEFDWKQHQVTFERGEQKKTTPFAGDTMDWLSMIFQLAHVPPKPKGDTLEMAVFTQRKMYAFKLKVLGLEDIDIPLGTTKALHLRHVDSRNSDEVVDVWLGVDQHYLPVKMRYPVAKNRLMVEQSATRVSTR